MAAYNFVVQWMQDPWTKIDFSPIHLQTGLTNLGEYNSVSFGEF